MLSGMLTRCSGTLPTATVNLESLKPAPHAPEDLITRVAGCDHDSAATSPQFDKFIREVLPDTETRAFVQRLFGMALLGEVRDHVFVVFTGTGRNGKGVLAEIMLSVFGDYGTGINPKLARSNRSSTVTLPSCTRCADAGLQLRRSFRRVRSGTLARVKTLSGGDRITARRMREDEADFQAVTHVDRHHEPPSVG